MENLPERIAASGSLSQADHDTLIELKTTFRSFFDRYGNDMKELKDGVKTRVDDHELRIKKNENDMVAIGGVDVAWKRFLVVEKWVEEYQLKWRTLIAAGAAIGSLVTFALGIVAKLTGLIK